MLSTGGITEQIMLKQSGIQIVMQCWYYNCISFIYNNDAMLILFYFSDKQLDLEEALIRMERNRTQNDASSTCSGHTR